MTCPVPPTDPPEESDLRRIIEQEARRYEADLRAMAKEDAEGVA